MNTKIWLFPGLNMKVETFSQLQRFLEQQGYSTQCVAIFPPLGQIQMDYEADAAENEEWICIGHGAGCLEAIRVALQYKSRVKGLVTISPNLQPYSLIQMSMLKILARRDMKINGGLSPFERSSKEELTPYFDTFAVQPSKMLELEAFRKDLKSKIQDVNQPWLVLHGDKELPAIMKSLQVIKRQVSQVQSYQMPHCGHYLPLEDPKGLDKQIRAFLSQIVVTV